MSPAHLVLVAGLGLAWVIARQDTRGMDTLWKWVAAAFVAFFSLVFYVELP